MASLKIGLVGLGRMGQAVAYRLLKGGHEVFGFDPNVKTKPEDLNNLNLSTDLQDLTSKTDIIWLMVPAGKTVDSVIDQILPYLKEDSIIIDGGNSFYKNTVQRHEKVSRYNVKYLDCGTSGGLYGREIGFSLMIGGCKKTFEKVEPIFKSIAAPNGYDYMGPSGSGHYVKMVHNGIEYSILQAYAEGFDLLKNNNKYKDLDLEKISKTWMNGSVIRSWILDLTHEIFEKDQDLDSISGQIGENLTGKWTQDEAVEQNIPMHLLEKSLQIREWSRSSGGNFGTKVVAMLRNAFGGHQIKKK